MSAMTRLAYDYKRGAGVKKDMAAHYRWAKRAADLDDACAMTMVAVCHLYGDGTTKDHQNGLIECAEAAALGSEHACFVLANGYHDGLYGLKKDASRVAHWAARMRQAAGNGKCDCIEAHRARIAGYVAALP